MKIFKMIRGFFLKRSGSYKIMQNMIFHIKLLSATLSYVVEDAMNCELLHRQIALSIQKLLRQTYQGPPHRDLGSNITLAQ